MAGRRCTVILVKLFTPMCFCHHSPDSRL